MNPELVIFWSWLGLVFALFFMAAFDPKHKHRGVIPCMWHSLRDSVQSFLDLLFGKRKEETHIPNKAALLLARKDCKIQHQIVASELTVYNEVKSESCKKHTLECDKYKLTFDGHGVFTVVKNVPHYEYICEHDPRVVDTTLSGVEYVACGKCGRDMGTRKAS